MRTSPLWGGGREPGPSLLVSLHVHQEGTVLACAPGSIRSKGVTDHHPLPAGSVAPDSLVPAECASEQGGQAGCRLVAPTRGGAGVANFTPRLGTRFGRTNGNKGSMSRDWD